MLITSPAPELAIPVSETTKNISIGSTDVEYVLDEPLSKWPLLDPVAAFEEWKKYHSIEALRKDEDLSSRKYILGRFSCPRQAGILAADFANARLVAVATNRTFLFRYGGMGGNIRSGASAPELCERILTRADWLPLWSEFEDRLDEPVKLNSTFFKHHRQIINVEGPDVEVPALLADSQVVSYTRGWTFATFPEQWGGFINYASPSGGSFYSQVFGLDKHLDEEERIQKLYAEGPLFLYGMLYTKSFSYTEELLQSVANDLPAASVGNEKTVFSVGLHARHASVKDTGEDIHGEMRCLDRLMRQGNRRRLPCRLHHMSDRKPTLEGVAAYAKEKHNCTVVVTSDIVPTKEQLVEEHGPAAGMGYFQDLVLVSQAKSAFVSNLRSSSTLVMEMVEYNRRMDAWRSHGTRQLPPLPRCDIH